MAFGGKKNISPSFVTIFFPATQGTDSKSSFLLVSFLFSYNVSNNIYIESHMHFINN